MKLHLVYPILVVSLLFPGFVVSARECPSKLPSHMFQVLDSLELGLEFRSFYFGAAVGDGLPSSDEDPERDFQNNLMLALKPAAAWFPVDGLTLSFEAEVRFAYPGWETNTPQGTDFRLAQALVEYDPGDYRLTAGLQSINFGSAALLDQRFVGFSGEYKTKPFNVSMFAGVTSRKFMRSATNCMWMRYASDTIGWKVASAKFYENIGAGLMASYKGMRPYRLMAMYLFSHPTSIEELQSHAVSVHFGGPLVEKYVSFALDAIGYIDHDGYLLPGLVLEMRARAGGKTAPRFKLGLASSFRESDEHRIMSPYENLSWGLIRRYSLYNGHVAYVGAAWPFLEYVKPFIHYYAQSFSMGADDFEDELDVGLDLALTDLYRLRLAYVGINLFSERAPTDAFYAELRIVFGE